MVGSNLMVGSKPILAKDEQNYVTSFDLYSQIYTISNAAARKIKHSEPIAPFIKKDELSRHKERNKSASSVYLGDLQNADKKNRKLTVYTFHR